MLFAVSFPHRRPGVCRDVQHAHCPVSQTHLCAEEISEPGGPVIPWSSDALLHLEEPSSEVLGWQPWEPWSMLNPIPRLPAI